MINFAQPFQPCTLKCVFQESSSFSTSRMHVNHSSRQQVSCLYASLPWMCFSRSQSRHIYYYFPQPIDRCFLFLFMCAQHCIFIRTWAKGSSSISLIFTILSIGSRDCPWYRWTDLDRDQSWLNLEMNVISLEAHERSCSIIDVNGSVSADLSVVYVLTF